MDSCTFICLLYLELFIYTLLISSGVVRAPARLRCWIVSACGRWQRGIELVSLRLWNPSITPGGHHNRHEDVVSSHVAVPPMIIYAL